MVQNASVDAVLSVTVKRKKKGHLILFKIVKTSLKAQDIKRDKMSAAKKV